ncbi:MAG TPA: GNAT family N-acetyltransferase [Terriglobales bacterium]|nr:GNAT family N-acetyltransferase [Terriglobales bacterium]
MSARRSIGKLLIRPISAGDRNIWAPLWKGYLDFYAKRIPEQTTDFTWKRLTRTGEIHGFIAVDGAGNGLGLTHYFFHPSTSTIGGNCYLQDLFVSPSARARGIGRQLIAAVVEAARKKYVAVVYWQTEEFNMTARRLYERVAKRSPFIRYNIEL